MNRNKKILFIGDAMSVHLSKWVNYFVLSKYDVYLATFSRENKTKCKNVYYLSSKKVKVGGGNLHYLKYIWKLARLIKSINPDFINAHFSYSIGFVAAIAHKISKVNCSFSVVCHGSDVLNPHFKKIANKTNSIALNHSEKVIAVSDLISDVLKKQYHIDSHKILTVQYGINKNDINKISFKDKDIDIISNRNYVPNSQIDELLEALDKEEFRKRKIVFVLPHVSDGKLAEFKKKYSHVDFYKAVTHSKAIDLVSRSKIYISATISDGTSLSLLEAMANGAVPVVSNIVPNRSWIVDGLNGLMFNDFAEFAQTVQGLLAMKKNDLANIQKNNYKVINDKVLYHDNMKKIEDFLFQKNE